MKEIIKYFQNRRSQKIAEQELVNEILRSLQEEYNQWWIDEYKARFGSLSIWIANSPYADMTINNRRLPRRGELRKAVSFCLMAQARDALGKSTVGAIRHFLFKKK
jgi:hypothetical protein